MKTVAVAMAMYSWCQKLLPCCAHAALLMHVVCIAVHCLTALTQPGYVCAACVGTGVIDLYLLGCIPMPRCVSTWGLEK